MTQKLMTLEDIQAITQLTRIYVRNRLVKRPDFPRPAVVISQKNRRWLYTDVMNWVDQQKAKLAR